MTLDTGTNILRCPRCNKPFDKEASLKRHGYYCRSRNAPPTSRVRSCTTCAKSKARCDSVRPACSRCSARGVDCQYPGRARGRSSQHAETNAAVAPLWSTAADLETGSPDNEDLLTNSSSVDTDPWNVDWNDSPVDLTSLLDVEDFGAPAITMKDLFSYPSPASLPWNQHVASTTSPYPAFAEHFKYNNIIPTPQSFPSTRSLVTRQRPAPGTSGITKLILATLKSYPLMLLRHNTLPPFVHPRWLSGPADAQAQAQIEPLTNCVSLMHMLSSGLSSSRKLFWRNVRLECEQLRAGLHSLGARGLLAGMQALSLYILVRVGEGETEHNNVDALLVGMVAALSRELVARFAPGQGERQGQIASEAPMAYPSPSSPSSTGPVLAAAMAAVAAADSGAVDNYDSRARGEGSPDADWDAWIFEESKRRLCIVYQVVNLLVYFEPAALCGLQTEYVLAPLPHRRQVWEAQDRASWVAAEAQGKPRADYALAADGELVEVDARSIYGGSGKGRPTTYGDGLWQRKVANWEDWCAGMDSLGGLIMLAGSLVAS